MKRFFLILLFISVLSTASSSCSTSKDNKTTAEDESPNDISMSNSVKDSQLDFGYDFRLDNWGESRSVIENREGELLFTAGENPNESDILTGEVTINGYLAFFNYAFMDDKLIAGTYVITSEDGPLTQYLQMFNSFLTYLTNECGDPSAKGTIPYDQDIPRNSSQSTPILDFNINWEDARNYAIFETSTSDILLELAIHDRGADFMITYTDTSFYAGKNGSGSEDTSRAICDFRNAKWGDSRSDILKYEPDLNIVEENGTGIMASGTVSGYDAAILYFFDNNGKLHEAGYGLNVNYTNPGQYIPAYETLKDRLSEKYGDSEGAIIPLADQQLIDMAGAGPALQFGYVEYIDMWETDTTGIVLTMSAENFEITIMIRYMDINWERNPDDGL